MRRLSFTIFWGLLLLPASSAIAQRDATQWRDLAAQDLKGIHDELLHSSPAPLVPVGGDAFRDWIDRGLADALRQLSAVTDGRSYYYLLKGYAGGFRDSHITVSPLKTKTFDIGALASPGFSLAFQQGHYVVNQVSPNSAQTHPSLGARLLSCDGVEAGELARRRLDRFHGNLDLVSDRYRTASKLLLDFGNPFAGPRPRSCTFKTKESVRDYALHYGGSDGSAKAPKVQEGATALLGSARISEGIWWLRLPSMRQDQAWDGFFAGIEANLAALRTSRLIVVDLRGNGGGDSFYADRIAKLLWGHELVEAKRRSSGKVVWRVSPANRAYLTEVIARVTPEAGGNERAAYYRDLIARMDAAEAAAEPAFSLVPSVREISDKQVLNPLKAKVVLFTDYACNSACLNLMDLYLAMPDTVQAGTETYADTIFMEVTKVLLPSGATELQFGHKAYVERPRGSNISYRPKAEFRFEGNLEDDEAVRSWVINRFEQSPRD